MKRFFFPVLALLVLLLLIVPVSADPGCERTFTIEGTTGDYQHRTLPSGLTQFHAISQGTITGDIANYGEFTMLEWGLVDFDPETGIGSGEGINGGMLDVVAPGSEGSIRFTFKGSFNVFEGVQGTFKVFRGTGDYTDLRGRGTYEGGVGVPGMPFEVTFTGNFTGIACESGD